uniref:POU domain protein n=1 Tax=Strongyloides venezuelensis TaxID=75913 RepID=A0A0K0FU23_STRVS
MQSSTIDTLPQDSMHNVELLRNVLQLNNSIPTINSQNVSHSSPFLSTFSTPTNTTATTSGGNNISTSMGLLPMINGNTNSFSNNYLYNSSQLSLDNLINLIISNPLVFGNNSMNSQNLINWMVFQALGNNQNPPTLTKNRQFIPTPVNIPQQQKPQQPPTSVYDRITIPSDNYMSSFQLSSNALFNNNTPSSGTGATVNSNLYLQHLADLLIANQNKFQSNGVVYNPSNVLPSTTNTTTDIGNDIATTPTSVTSSINGSGSAFNENKLLLQDTPLILPQPEKIRKLSENIGAITTTTSLLSLNNKISNTIKNSNESMSRKRKMSSSSTGHIEQMSSNDCGKDNTGDGDTIKQTSCTNSGRSSIELFERKRAFSDLPLVIKKKNIGSKASDNSPKRHHPDNLIPSDGKARLVESLAAMCLMNGEATRMLNTEIFASLWNDEDMKEEVTIKENILKGDFKIDESGYTSADSNYSNCGVKLNSSGERKFSPLVTVNSRSVTPDASKDKGECENVMEEDRKDIKEGMVIDDDIHSPSSTEADSSSLSSSTDTSIKSSSPTIISRTPVSKKAFNDMLDGILNNILGN